MKWLRPGKSREVRSMLNPKQSPTVGSCSWTKKSSPDPVTANNGDIRTLVGLEPKEIEFSSASEQPGTSKELTKEDFEESEKEHDLSMSSTASTTEAIVTTEDEAWARRPATRKRKRRGGFPQENKKQKE